MYKYLNVLIFAIFISLNSNAYTSESQIPNLVERGLESIILCLNKEVIGHGIKK